MKGMHRHHLIPKHMGGTNDPSNLTPPISVEMHAEFHRMLWLDYGHKQDYIAWQGLSGRMTSEQSRIDAAKAGRDKSALYQESRKLVAAHIKKYTTFESRSAGGKAASKSLVAWQAENREKFLQQAAANGRASTERKCIPHTYKGVTYPSKKELQAAHNMSICGFYGKLGRGEIKREIAKREKAAV